MFITHTNEVYKSKDNKKKENRIIPDTNLSLNYHISIVKHENADV